MFDPFGVIESVESGTIDTDMIIVDVPLTTKTAGINEGLFMGLIIGILLCQFFGVR